MFPCLMLLSSPGWMALAALALVGMTLSHQGAFDASAVNDVLLSQCQYQSLALPAGGTFPQGAITGALDIVLTNTTNAPGTVTTRTAAQMVADLTAALGIAPPAGFVFFLTLQHAGTGTLTPAGGTGVTISNPTGGAVTVATLTARDFAVQVVNATTINMIATGSRANT